MKSLTNNTNRNEWIQLVRTRKADTAQPPKCNGGPESFKDWAGAFAPLASTHELGNALRPGNFMPVGEEADSGAVRSVDDLGERRFSVVQIRQNKDCETRHTSHDRMRPTRIRSIATTARARRPRHSRNFTCGNLRAGVNLHGRASADAIERGLTTLRSVAVDAT